MKKLLLGVLLLFSIIGYSQSLFHTATMTDEFGDKLNEVQRNIAYGTFSNTATSNSPLRVHTILVKQQHPTSFKEYLDLMYIHFKESGMSEKEIKNTLKYVKEKDYKDIINVLGGITFVLYEYDRDIGKLIHEKNGTIAIKKNGQKIVAPVTIVNNQIVIVGFKERTESLNDMIKYGHYNWNQSEVYQEISTSNENIEVVISIGSSTYKFTLKQ
jgi:predicted RNA-binding protein